MKIKKKITNLSKKIFFELFPLHRSLTGLGNIKTLKILSAITNFNVYHFRSGLKFGDWKIPQQWNFKRGTIHSLSGVKILDTKDNNLQIVSYSTPIKNKIFSTKFLLKKIHSLKNKKNTIPYITSYYKKNWGFCMKYNEKIKMNEKKYIVNINSSFSKGKLVFGHKLITAKTKTKKTILFSSNICHPSLFNNELSGPVILTLIAKIIENKKLNFNYLFLLLPETIGSIAYINKNINYLKENILMGFAVTMIGHGKEFMIVDNLQENSNAQYFAKISCPLPKSLKTYSFRYKGSDERQYCSANVDLDVVGLRRGTPSLYSEYHTSDDNMNIYNDKTIKESLQWILNIIKNIENEEYYQCIFLGEPMLSKRNLYHHLSTVDNIKRDLATHSLTKKLIDIAHLMNGRRSNSSIINILKLSRSEFKDYLNILISKKIIKKI